MGQVTGPLDDVDYVSIDTSRLRSWHRRALELVVSPPSASAGSGGGGGGSCFADFSDAMQGNSRGLSGSSGVSGVDTDNANGSVKTGTRSYFAPSSATAADADADMANIDIDIVFNDDDITGAPHARTVLTPLIRQTYVILQLRGAFQEMNEIDHAASKLRGRDGGVLTSASTSASASASTSHINRGGEGKRKYKDSGGHGHHHSHHLPAQPHLGISIGMERVISVFEELTHAQSGKYDTLPSTYIMKVV